MKPQCIDGLLGKLGPGKRVLTKCVNTAPVREKQGLLDAQVGELGPRSFNDRPNRTYELRGMPKLDQTLAAFPRGKGSPPGLENKS